MRARCEGQFDFGSGAPVIGPGGRRRRTSFLRITLSHSRKGYTEATFRQTTEDLIRCLENAFHEFGGAPETLVFDNAKSAVLRAEWCDPELNPKLAAFLAHYGTVLLPTKPRTPRHNGKAENSVGYVKGNALKGRVFASLAEQNEHLVHWEKTVADTRIFSWALPMKRTPSSPSKLRRYSWATSSLRRPRSKGNRGTPSRSANRSIEPTKVRDIGPICAPDAKLDPRWLRQKWAIPASRWRMGT